MRMRQLLARIKGVQCTTAAGQQQQQQQSCRRPEVGMTGASVVAGHRLGKERRHWLLGSES